MHSQLNRFYEIAAKLYPPFNTEDSVPLKEIKTAEKRLGCRLPAVLREYYQMLGDHEKINSSFNRLISVDWLEIDNGKLIFYQENQGVCDWAIDAVDLSLDDPPVWQITNAADGESAEWYQETKHLTTFLIASLCWQSVMAGLGCGAVAENASKEDVEKIAGRCESIDLDGDYREMQVFLKTGQVFCIFEKNDRFDIYTGAADESRFMETDELLQIEWDYSFLMDE